MFRSGIFFICIFISVSQTWASDYRRDIENLLYIENCHSIQELNIKASGNLSTPYPSTIKLAPDAENILIEAGSVIYYPYQFNDLNRIAEALSKENFAQERLAGCWGSDTYKTISADHDIHTGQFHIVEGTVQDVGESFENIFLNFGADWKTDFTVRIEKSNKNFDGYDFQSLKGQHLQVRGFVESYNGPSLDPHASRLDKRRRLTKRLIGGLITKNKCNKILRTVFESGVDFQK